MANVITLEDAQFLDKTNKILKSLTDSHWFSSLDLDNWYWNEYTLEEDEPRTASIYLLLLLQLSEGAVLRN